VRTETLAATQRASFCSLNSPRADSFHVGGGDSEGGESDVFSPRWEPAARMRVEHGLAIKSGKLSMSAMTDKATGAVDQTVGAVKRAAGRAVGNVNLEAEGEAQLANGKVRSAVGKAKDVVKNVIDKA
jgi:uncharacterized protein YjbJ (UPF0337 family)